MAGKAMILAAGLGTRLGEMTRDKPKALVKVHGIPLLEIILGKLQKQGFDDIVINVHHHAEMIRNYLDEHPAEGIKIALSEEKERPLETGGGIRHARELLLDVPVFLIHNVDILSDMDLRELVKEHIDSGALATLAVSCRKTARYLLADETGHLCGWENIATGEKIMTKKPEGQITQWGYSGVAVLSREVLFLLPEQDVFSLTHFFLQLASTRLVRISVLSMSYWYDVGKPLIIEAVQQNISKQKLLG